jgi:general secretion pathway protein I
MRVEIQQYKRNKAFTLIEVLIALVILAIAFLAIDRAISSSVLTELALENKTMAMWVADENLTEINLGMIDFSTTTIQHGHMSMLGREWPWAASVKPIPNTQSREVQVSVNVPGEVNNGLDLYGVI